MEVSLLGPVTLLAGIACLFARSETAIYWLMFFSIANAAGTFSISGFGLPPVNMFALFFCLRAVLLPYGTAVAVSSLRPPKAGFYLAMLVVLGVISAVFFPRIMQGATFIIFADRGLESQDTLLMRPLSGGSGNITQTFYLLEALAVFTAAHVYARYVAAEVLLRAFLFLALLNLAFAAFDVISDALGASYLMAPFRSGGYSILSQQVVGGIRRIIGSFPEPSSFASFSFQMFAGSFIMWHMSFGGRTMLLAMIANLMLLIVSTSTTGYVALAVITLMFLSWLLYSFFARGWLRRSGIAMFGIAFVGLAAAGFYAFELVPTAVSTVLGETLNKNDSVSAIERGAMNNQAWSNFTDTYGLGAGLGSARASSFFFVMLSNLGVVGAFLFLIFTAQLLLAGRPADRNSDRASILAKSQVVSILICACISGGVFDLGTQFYFWAGIVSALAIAARRSGVNAPSRHHAYASAEGAH